MKLTKLQAACRDAVELWCEKRKIALVSRPHHIYPRCYVLAKSGSSLVIARPAADAEPHLRDLEMKIGRSFDIVSHFDASLEPARWCTSAYVCTKSWQMTVAIPVVIV